MLVMSFCPGFGIALYQKQIIVLLKTAMSYFKAFFSILILFNFKEQLQTVLNVSNLDDLDENKDIERLYSDYLSGKQFLDMYVKFIRKYITNLYDGIVAYQIKPACRLVYKNKLNMHK